MILWKVSADRWSQTRLHRTDMSAMYEGQGSQLMLKVIAESKCCMHNLSPCLIQSCDRGAGCGIKAEALLQRLPQPGWQTVRHLRGPPPQHSRCHLHLCEACVWQLASDQVQHAGGKAPDICVRASRSKLRVCLFRCPAYEAPSHATSVMLSIIVSVGLPTAADMHREFWFTQTGLCNT